MECTAPDPEEVMATENLETKIVNLEKEFWQAIKEQDAATITKLTDDPCLVAGSQGIMRLSRDAVADMVTHANYKLHAFELKNPLVRVLGDDVAIVAYNAHEQLTVDGKPLTLDVSEASTWVRRNGNWVCALHTESIAGDAFGRDRKGS